MLKHTKQKMPTVASRWELSAFKVLLLAAILFFARLGERPFWGPEGRWAEVAREMQASGNYFWPTINGEVHFGKPLLSYWLIAAAGSFGGDLNEFTARLPSAVLGLVGVGLVILLARRIYDHQTAIVAGIVLATSYSYVFFSRLAAADIAAVTGVLAVLTLFVHKENHKGGLWILGMWATMAATSLTKGLTGFALPLLVMTAYTLLTEGWRNLLHQVWQSSMEQKRVWLLSRCGWLFNATTLTAVIIAAFLYLSPFIVSALTMQSVAGISLVWRENVVRFVAPFDHRGPMYLYVHAIFLLLAPWAVFLPAALIQIHSEPVSKSNRFSLTYFWAIFLFFTLSGSRRDYYMLPVLPAAAILLARLFVTTKDELERRASWLMKLGFALIALLAVSIGPLAFLPVSLRPGGLSQLPVAPDRVPLGLSWLCMLLSILYAIKSLQSKRILLSVSVIAYFFLGYIYCFAFPAARQFAKEKAFGQEVQQTLGGDLSRLVFYKVGDPALCFYLRTEGPIREYKEGVDLMRLIERDPDIWIIARERDLVSLPARGVVVARALEFSWESATRWQTKYVLFRPATAP